MAHGRLIEYISCRPRNAYVVRAGPGLKAQSLHGLLKPGPDTRAGQGGVEPRHTESQVLERGLEKEGEGASWYGSL